MQQTEHCWVAQWQFSVPQRLETNTFSEVVQSGGEAGSQGGKNINL